MPWLSRVSIHPVSAGRFNLSVMAAAYSIFGLSLLFQPHRWESTPAYHVLLEIFAAPAWGGLFLVSGVTLAAAAWQFGRRWLVIAALTLAVALTVGWMLAFVARYLSSLTTTPETWVSWAVFGILLLQVAAGLDRPRGARRETPELNAYRQAVDDALDAAAASRQAAVGAVLDAEAGRLRDAVSTACDAYGEALRAVVPAAAMPAAGDPARQALDEASERAAGPPPTP